MLERRILDNRKSSDRLSKACAAGKLPDVGACGEALLGHVVRGTASFTAVPPSSMETRFTHSQLNKVRQQLAEQGQVHPFIGGMGVGLGDGDGAADVLLYEEKGTFHLKGAGEMSMRREYLYLVGSPVVESQSGHDSWAPDVCVFFHIPNNEAEHLNFFHRLRFGTRRHPEEGGTGSVPRATQDVTVRPTVAHAEHLCVQDLYTVEFSIDAPEDAGLARAAGAASKACAAGAKEGSRITGHSFDSFTTSWNVTGPSKDYTIHSHYTRR